MDDRELARGFYCLGIARTPEMEAQAEEVARARGRIHKTWTRAKMRHKSRSASRAIFIGTMGEIAARQAFANAELGPEILKPAKDAVQRADELDPDFCFQRWDGYPCSIGVKTSEAPSLREGMSWGGWLYPEKRSDKRVVRPPDEVLYAILAPDRVWLVCSAPWSKISEARTREINGAEAHVVSWKACQGFDQLVHRVKRAIDPNQGSTEVLYELVTADATTYRPETLPVHQIDAAEHKSLLDQERRRTAWDRGDV